MRGRKRKKEVERQEGMEPPRGVRCPQRPCRSFLGPSLGSELRCVSRRLLSMSTSTGCNVARGEGEGMPINVIQSANAARCQEGVQFGWEKEAGSDGGDFGVGLLYIQQGEIVGEGRLCRPGGCLIRLARHGSKVHLGEVGRL